MTSPVISFFDRLGAWFKSIETPAASSAVSNVAATLKTAATTVETALPAVATAAANAALALIPGGLGSDFDPIADNLIDQVIALLEGKKSTATGAAATTTATPATATAGMVVG
ncbi:MAG TPA: hypothetical protein VE309_03155 [Caulobacteraceae bacterium]|jgi:hypothetical protein|nr:hypothetical protein [Caulobacteraceae bacterium]